MAMSRRTYILIGIIILCIFTFVFTLPKKGNHQAEKTRTIVLEGKSYRVHIAKNPQERAQGLSGMNSLPEGEEGMLFVFKEPGIYGFWMKDMLFSIDIIWIDSTWQVIGKEKGVEPSTYPTIFYPSKPIQYVLEVPATTTTKRYPQ